VKTQQRYRFAIFESDAEQLRKLTENCNTGAGIYFDNTVRYVWVNSAIARA
jgi:hypothetical protein